MNNLTKKSKLWIAGALARLFAESEKEFLSMRSFYLNMYTKEELINKYIKEEI